MDPTFSGPLVRRLHATLATPCTPIGHDESRADFQSPPGAQASVYAIDPRRGECWVHSGRRIAWSPCAKRKTTFARTLTPRAHASGVEYFLGLWLMPSYSPGMTTIARWFSRRPVPERRTWRP